MVETHWDGLRGRELRYAGHTWSLTGDLEVRERGELLAVEARQVDGVKRRRATLYFGVEDGPRSLNPGNLGEGFERFERGETYALVVRTEPRRYRYVLHRLEYA